MYLSNYILSIIVGRRLKLLSPNTVQPMRTTLRLWWYIYLSIYLSIYNSGMETEAIITKYRPTHAHHFVAMVVYLSFYLSIYLYIYLSIYLSIYLVRRRLKLFSPSTNPPMWSTWQPWWVDSLRTWRPMKTSSGNLKKKKLHYIKFQQR